MPVDRNLEALIKARDKALAARDRAYATFCKAHAVLDKAYAALAAYEVPAERDHADR